MIKLSIDFTGLQMNETSILWDKTYSLGVVKSLFPHVFVLLHAKCLITG